ncbi:GNAT family N-acetyltransferase [Sagittula sp. MA-2]|jgi:GNAT superfamily N-acetyltransferase|uniref:GNAT family N-acetyltransferase n=1 Tax=Sagittula sp. MA-2 TaxID=3048007 RepID=UPI0024C3E8A2|nr:GNAT family N-acetyltransferase [Sagittula sp. MA-2]WHZ34403.1 GNAT family N-acetyltransferase [Sagittula sp. MA-2]
MIPIRAATPDDMPACARIVHDWETGTGYIQGTPDVDTLTGYLAEAFPVRDMHVAGDPVEGYLSIAPSSNRIGAIYLARPGQGTGKRLMDLAKEGRETLWLTVYAPNTRAQAFYRREGFTETARLDADRDGAPPMLRMDWTRTEVAR